MPTKIEKDSITGTNTTGHEWDGLKELNTPLPKWWLYVFYATIAFSIVWMAIYPSLPVTGARGLSGWTARGAIGPALEAEKAAREPMLAKLRAATPAQIAADPEMRAFALAGGRIAFANNCAGCHGAGGQGAPGGFPSLADDDWLYGGSFDAIQHTIRHGVRNGESDEARGVAMPRFQADGLLKAEQVADTAEYVLSLTGRATDAAAAQRGGQVFAENCVSCHGEKGEGNRDMGAPRLNDQVWLYGGDKASLMRSIGWSRAGVMPSWGGRLDPATVNMLTVYVHALGGGE
ncbi:cytochrome-c oxidase, cbb3-type subunit III [Paracraurococcus ruber]|uniref:Cbb3-type cytochrome c oxidase subunit n=1 Tax=Paracraurococcus ruber TaxID=77675 RepID=A0ABS1CYB7_9PROT|nr:cytochrome-c oxidase, cbb3-type subunit III [Paracraurococcus ruber]MBK1659398.1 cytochrome-c oxidase, cbb3-type subunit III [Paracraurococcus ruber]TDG30490.1 cytochrome-c oxidase, cbb3-type subunit III [Paracraurococcus ruber]